MTFDIPDTAVEWLRAGARGQSSDTIFVRMTGLPVSPYRGYPRDPSDLIRCVLLLEAVPEFAARFACMADVSKEWAALVPRWTEIVALLNEEAPRWRDGRGEAPKTYALMCDVLGIKRAGLRMESTKR